MDIDTTKPNAGRIYDYLLGGHHNFEADRRAAEMIMRSTPQAAKWMRLNRWFLNYAVDELVGAGFGHYIDLATGLPTQDYLHERAPDNAAILYSDIDPATVTYARQMLQGRTNIRYVLADVREIDQVLREAESFFGPARRVGICMVGIAYYISDDELKRTLQRLYDWAAPGSQLAISLITVERPLDRSVEAAKVYQQMGVTMYGRTMEELPALLRPWQPLGRGLLPLTDYVREYIPPSMTFEKTSANESMAGGIFHKPH